MSRIRLSPSASITPTPAGVLLRSDLGTFQVTGADVATFLERIAPLLDGTRDRAAIVAALSSYAPRSVEAFLDLLAARGLIEDVPAAESALHERWRGQEAFFRGWGGSPEAAMQRLAGARVLVAGLTPWGAAAAVELAAAGLGALHLVDDDPARREAAAVRVRETAPWCRVRSAEEAAIDAAGEPCSLVVAALPPGDAARVERIARFAHRAGVRSLWSQLAGATALLGPLVVPGRTACRICAAAEGLNPPLADRAPGARVEGMDQILGHLAALEAIKVIAEYTSPKLGGQLLVVDPVSLETNAHRLVQLPWCRVCRDDVRRRRA